MNNNLNDTTFCKGNDDQVDMTTDKVMTRYKKHNLPATSSAIFSIACVWADVDVKWFNNNQSKSRKLVSP